MSIISDALKKAAQKRRAFVVKEDTPLTHSYVTNEDLTVDIQETASRKIRWVMLGGLGALFAIGAAAILHLYNLNLRPLADPVNEPEASVEAARPIENVPTAATVPLKGSADMAVVEKRRPLLPLLEINGVMAGGGDQPMAIINNMILKKGDYVEGAKILEIDSNKVILLFDNKEITIYVDR